MSNYHRITASDWVIVLGAIFAAASINSVFGFEYALAQAIATAVILFIDKEYVKVLAFLVVYIITVFFAPVSADAVLFACFVFGAVLVRVIKWRQYHRVKKAKEFMEE
jgi:hypothetical protein